MISGYQETCLQLSDGIVEDLGQCDVIADDALHLLTKALDGWRRP